MDLVKSKVPMSLKVKSQDGLIIKKSMKDAVSAHCKLFRMGCRLTKYINLYEKLFKEFMNARFK